MPHHKIARSRVELVCVGSGNVAANKLSTGGIQRLVFFAVACCHRSVDGHVDSVVNKANRSIRKRKIQTTGMVASERV